MRVADLMHANVIAVGINDPLSAAIQALADEHISGLPVLDGEGRVVGVLSTSDLMEAEAEAGSEGTKQLLSETLVHEIMTRHPLLIGPDAQLKEAAQQMLYGEVHRLFVEAEGKLVGVVSQTDIVRAVASGWSEAAPMLHITKPAEQRPDPKARAGTPVRSGRANTGNSGDAKKSGRSLDR